MQQRGRKSASSLTVIQAGPVETIQRPDSPYDLDDEQSDEWRKVVNRLPADWFPPETHAMLAQYCRHVVSARRIAQLIRAELKSEKLNLEVYDDLLKMQERESKAIGTLATRMRITQQSTMRVETLKKPKQVAKPWEA
jgi:hypothetical protein